MTRRDKDNYYLDVAQTISKRATCLRRSFGSVIVNHDEIISCGYNGAPRGKTNCTEIRVCRRTELNIPKGQCYELCRSVHAEANAIIHASRKNCIDAHLYLVGIEKESNSYVKDAFPCLMCQRFIINAGIVNVIVRVSDEKFIISKVNDWLNEDIFYGDFHSSLNYHI